jgi:hypothetical protein
MDRVLKPFSDMTRFKKAQTLSESVFDDQIDESGTCQSAARGERIAWTGLWWRPRDPKYAKSKRAGGVVW